MKRTRLVTLRNSNYGRRYERIRCYLYGFRRYDRGNALQRLFRAVASRSPVRHWYSRVLHGIPLGSSSARGQVVGMETVPVHGFSRYVFAGALSLVLLGSFISAPAKAYAEIIVSNTSDNSVVATNNFGKQGLGTGLTGIPTFVSFYASSTSGSADTLSGLTIFQCNDSAYSVGCYSYATQPALVSVSASKALNSITVTATTSMVSSKYYFVDFGNTSGSERLYGSSASTYPNGQYCRNTPLSASSCSSYDATLTGDVWFTIGNTPNYQTEGITAITTPTYAQLLPSGNNVNFNFTYYINSLTYNKAGFFLKDNTSGQSIDTSSLDETINASGLSTFDAYFDLITGHNYTWTPYLYSTTASSTYLFGTPTFFFTGTNRSTPLPQKPYNPFSTTSSSTAFWLSTSTGRITWTGGTTSSPFGGVLTPDLDALLATKVPFSYLYDFTTLLSELANGTGGISSCSNSDAYYTLPTGSLGSHLSNGSTTVKIIDACAVQGYSTTQEIRKVIGYALYLITAAGLIAMATSMI